MTAYAPVPCPRCGKAFKDLAQHWNAASNCDYPELTRTQETALDIIAAKYKVVGNPQTNNPKLRIRSTDPSFLAVVQEKLDWMACDIRKRDAYESGTDDVYELSVRSHPYLKKYRRD